MYLYMCIYIYMRGRGAESYKRIENIDVAHGAAGWSVVLDTLTTCSYRYGCRYTYLSATGPSVPEWSDRGSTGVPLEGLLVDL